jgi:hypothetical protein
MVKKRRLLIMKTSRAMSQCVSFVKVYVGTVEFAKRLRYGTREILSLSEHIQEEFGRRWEDFGE